MVWTLKYSRNNTLRVLGFAFTDFLCCSLYSSRTLSLKLFSYPTGIFNKPLNIKLFKLLFLPHSLHVFLLTCLLNSVWESMWFINAIDWAYFLTSLTWNFLKAENCPQTTTKSVERWRILYVCLLQWHNPSCFYVNYRELWHPQGSSSSPWPPRSMCKSTAHMD